MNTTNYNINFFKVEDIWKSQNASVDFKAIYLIEIYKLYIL